MAISEEEKKDRARRVAEYQQELLATTPRPQDKPIKLPTLLEQNRRLEKTLEEFYKPIPDKVRIRDVVRETVALMEPETPEERVEQMTLDIGLSGISGIGRLVKTGKGVAKKIIPKIIKEKPAKKIVDIVSPKLESLAETVKGVGTKERKFITSVKKQRPELALKVAGQYIPRSTDNLAIKAKNLIRDNIAEAERMAFNESNDKAVAVASELIKHYSDEAARATSSAVSETLYSSAADIANTIARRLTEQGRSVQAASILSRLTPEGQLKFAAREIQKYNELVGLRKKIPELTREQSRKILEEMKAIELMPDGIEKAIKFKELQDNIKSLIPSKLIDKIITVWKAGLLTGIKTSGLNIFANVSHFTTEIVKDIPAILVDRLASLITGRKTIGFTIKGIPGGTKEGIRKGWRYFTTGYDERNIARKLDWKQVNLGNSKLAKGIQRYEETIFRALGAEDQAFYYGSKARSLFDQSIAVAKNKGLKGDELNKYVEYLVKNPTDDMLTYASLDAETAVFQNRTALGGAARKIQQIPGGVGEIIIPFGRTPAAVAQQIINYSPVGIVNIIIKNIISGRFDQRLFSQAIGRGVTGTGILYIGTELFKNDLITLDYPKTEREQKLWELEGRKPNSIKIGDKWRTVATMGPAGPVLLIGGHYQKGLDDTGSPSKAIMQAAGGGAKSFSEQTFLQGVNRAVQAVTDPERSMEMFFGNLVSSTIPTIISDFSRALDPFERRVETISQRVQAKIPEFREKLEPRITVLGEERPRGGNILETMIDPTRPSKEISTDLIEELRRLYNIDYKVSPTLLGDKKGYKALTPKQNTELWKLAGTIIEGKLNNLITLQRYTDLSDEKKAEAISYVVNKSKIIARASTVMELTENLYGKELRSKLSELKESKFLTRDVYNKYRELK